MKNAVRLCFPQPFIFAMREILPDKTDFDAFMAASQRPLRLSLRVNTLKISVDDFQRQIACYHWILTPIPWCDEGFWVSRHHADDLPAGSIAEHLSGLFYLQEASSMLPVSALFDVLPHPEQILDVAAAPGSKTTQMAARMNNQGAIVANEFSASRAKILHANLSRCGITNTGITHFDGRVFGAALPECFDAVLLDAPCSGEGVIRKDTHALRHWSQENIRTIAKTQAELLDSAFHSLKPGGILIYSTCTLNLTENQQVVASLLARYPHAIETVPLNNLFDGAGDAVTDEGYLHVFPHIYDSEGFFVARLRKTASVAPPVKSPVNITFPFKTLPPLQAHNIIHAARAAGLHWDKTLTLWQRDNQLWLFPKTIHPLLGKVRFSRIGLKLAETFTKGYRWQHEAVIALARPDNENSIALTEKQAESWYRGQDISGVAALPRDEYIITWQQQPIGRAKKVNGRLKNSYPRQLVRNGRLFRA